MSISSVSHNHLRKLIEDYPYQEADLSTDTSFHMELAYSTFIVPTFPVNGKRAIHLLDHKFIPLFTDLDEYNGMYGDNGNLTPVAYDFDYILSANNDMILNPSSEYVFVDIDWFKDKPETPFFEYDSKYAGYNYAELELLARKIRNRQLHEYIRNQYSSYDCEEFFTLLGKSVLLTLAHLNAADDIVDLTDSLSPIIINDFGCLEIFTGIDQIRRGPDSYVQVINLAQFFEMVIRFDFEGIIINPDTDDVRISREMILLNFEKFRDNYDWSKYMQAHNYAFRLGNLKER